MRQEFTANVSHELKTAADQHFRLCRDDRDGAGSPRGRGFLRAEDPQRGQPDAAAGERHHPAVPSGRFGQHPERPRDGAGRPGRHRPGVRRAPEGERPAGLCHPKLPGRQRPGDGFPPACWKSCAKTCATTPSATTSRGGRVLLETGCTREGYPYLSVQDNGIGIPKEAQSSVFERFLPGGQEPQQSHRRHRPGPGHRQADRTHPQRPHPAEQRGGGGHHRHHHL